MKVAHVLRKYHPAEWGGTETAVQRLLGGLALHGVRSVVFAPKIEADPATDPIQESGHAVQRFHAFLPVARLEPEQKRQLISVGGNLMSFELPIKLSREPHVSLIHTHALNRIGGIALAVARRRRVPLVLTVHGGALDLPEAAKAALLKPLQGGIEWGKIFGLLLRSREVLARADAILTCNPREAELVREKFPGKRVLTQPHGVPVQLYQKDCRAAARSAFPQLKGRKVLLAAGRIDPTKNQLWLVQQMPGLLARHPDALLVLAGSCTDEAYGKGLKKEIRNLGLESHVLLTGGLTATDPRLIGLFQEAVVLLLPSLSETFGLVIVEAWAAGTPVIATRTSGACSLIKERENGWFFDLNEPRSFHAAVDEVLGHPSFAASLGRAGQQLVAERFDTNALAARVKDLYAELIEKKHALRRSS